ncbi:MAG: hypothetical protein L7F77_04630 [Candidatus Magnetominusculus sp. LBB02]|nr:hypothetical protein [Candidatus Magnetominusculus sp. LBB02]
MKRGFTRSWRRELTSNVWAMPPMYHRVFYWLRQKAKWKPDLVPTDRGLGIWLDPGMLITSYQIIAEGVAYLDMGIVRQPSKKTIGKILKWLQINEQIQLIAGHYGTTIKISNWDKYQNAVAAPLQTKGGGRGKRRKPDPYAHLYIKTVNRRAEAYHD